MYMFQRALTRGTRWCPNCAASFLSSKFFFCKKTTFVKKSFFLRFLHLAPQPLMLAQI